MKRAADTCATCRTTAETVTPRASAPVLQTQIAYVAVFPGRTLLLENGWTDTQSLAVLGLGDGDGVGLLVGDGLLDGDGLLLGDGVPVDEVELLGVGVPVEAGDVLGAAVAVGVVDWLGVAVAVGVADLLGVWVAVDVLDLLGVKEGLVGVVLVLVVALLCRVGWLTDPPMIWAFATESNDGGWPAAACE